MTSTAYPYKVHLIALLLTNFPICVSIRLLFPKTFHKKMKNFDCFCAQIIENFKNFQSYIPRIVRFFALLSANFVRKTPTVFEKTPSAPFRLKCPKTAMGINISLLGGWDSPSRPMCGPGLKLFLVGDPPEFLE